MEKTTLVKKILVEGDTWEIKHGVVDPIYYYGYSEYVLFKNGALYIDDEGCVEFSSLEYALKAIYLGID